MLRVQAQNEQGEWITLLVFNPKPGPDKLAPAEPIHYDMAAAGGPFVTKNGAAIYSVSFNQPLSVWSVWK